MTDQNDPSQNDASKLTDLLIEQGLIVEAQAELALADQEINEIPIEEVLLVRGWVSQEKLYAVAPWLKPGSKEKAPWNKPAVNKNSELEVSLKTPHRLALEHPHHPLEKKSAEKADDSPPESEAVAEKSDSISQTKSSDKALPNAELKTNSEKTADKVSKESSSQAKETGSSSSKNTAPNHDYAENLSSYKELMKKVLGPDFD